MLGDFEAFRDIFNSSSLSAEALAEDLGGVDDVIVNYAKNCKNGELTTEGFKTSLQGMTLGAKAGQIALQGLAMAGNMIAMWAITKVIEEVAKAIDNYVNAWENATEVLEEHSSAYEDAISEIESISSKIEELDVQIAELNGLDPITNADDIEKLELERKILEAQVELLKQKRDLEREEANKAAEDYFNTTQKSKVNVNTISTPQTTGDASVDAGAALGTLIYNKTNGEYVTPEEELQNAINKIKEYKQQIADLDPKEDAQEITDLEAKIVDVQTDANALATTMLENSESLADATRKEEIVGLVTEYNNLTDSINSYTDALNENTDAKQENANKSELLSFTDQISQVQSLSDGLDQLDKIYKDVQDGEGFDFSSILNNADFTETFSKYTGEYENFLKTVSESPNDINACQEAFNKLASAYVYGTGALKGLTEESKEAVIQILEQMGVTNARVIIEEQKTINELLSKTEKYINEKGEIDNAYLSSLSENDRKLINALTDTYSTDYNNWVDLLTQKTNAYNKFVTAIKGSQESIMSSSVVSDESKANAIISNYEKYGAKSIGLVGLNDFGISSLPYSLNSNKQYAKYTKEEYDAAKNYIESLELTNELKNSLSLSLAEISPNFEGYSGSSSSSASKTEKTFDHIETALSNMEDALSDLDSKVADTYSTWAERNNALTQSINKTKEAIQLQYNAYSAYMSMANSVGLSDFYKNLVHNGAMNISVITDETLANQISQYQDYYEKAQNALKTANELQSTLNEISSSEKWDLIKSESDANISELDAYLDSVQTSIDKLELQGKFANTSAYEDMYNLSVNKITVLKNQADQLSNILGTMSKDTEAYDTMFEELLSIRQEISELENDCIEFNNNIRDLNWEVFEYLENSISRINDEMDYLVGLLANEDLFDEKGKRTKYADATIALHAASYDVYKQQAEDYKEEMLSLQEQLVNGNMDVLEQYYNMVDAHQDAINAANDEKQAILDLVRDGYEAQKDALQDVIDKKKESLSIEKETFDYQNSINDLVEERDSIQKQILAYKNDTSESGRSTLQQLESKLADVEENLEQTEYEKYLSDTEQLLDSLTLEYEEWMNQRIDNSDALLQEIISNLQTEGDEINTTLTEVAEKNGTLISDSITSIFDTQSPFTSSLTNISNGVAGTTTAINNLIAKVEGITGILSASNAGTVSGTGGSSATTSSITSTPTNVSTSSTPIVTTTTSTNTTTTSTSSNSSSSGWESALVYSKYLGDKNKLNTNTSIVDLLKKHDKSAEWNDRANLYYAMGGSGTYRGSSSQNRFMIDTMKAKGYKKGSSNIPYDQMSWVHDGEVVLKRVSDGGYLTDLTAASKVLTEEQVQNMLNWSKMNPQVLKPNVSIPSMPTVQNQQMQNQNITIDMGGITMNGVNDPQELAQNIRRVLATDTRTEKILDCKIAGRMQGKPDTSRFYI